MWARRRTSPQSPSKSPHPHFRPHIYLRAFASMSAKDTPIDNKTRLAVIAADITRRNEKVREGASQEMTTAFNSWLRCTDGKVPRTLTNYTKWTASPSCIIFPHASFAHPSISSNITAIAKSHGYIVKPADDGSLTVMINGDLPKELKRGAFVSTSSEEVVPASTVVNIGGVPVTVSLTTTAVTPSSSDDMVPTPTSTPPPEPAEKK